MPSSLSGEDRAKVIANNRSLRVIKNELEALSERDFITDEQYATIIQALPAEASLHNAVLPIPGRGSTTTTSPPSAPLTDNFAAMSMTDRQPLHSRTSSSSNTHAPPSYNPAPTSAPPPPLQPEKPTELAHVVALYRYHDPDPRDLNFEPGDHISVTEYCNAEWWQGKNARTGDEGIFPKNYVRQDPTPSPLAQAQAQPPQYGNGQERAGPYMYGGQPPPQGGYYANQQPPPQQQHQQQGPPGPSNPYNSAVPPMQIAEQPVGQQQQQQQPSKGSEAGKKIGKKLGNAAIFGAGATIGGNLVNSIF